VVVRGARLKPRARIVSTTHWLDRRLTCPLPPWLFDQESTTPFRACVSKLVRNVSSCARGMCSATSWRGPTKHMYVRGRACLRKRREGGCYPYQANHPIGRPEAEEDGQIRALHKPTGQRRDLGRAVKRPRGHSVSQEGRCVAALASAELEHTAFVDELYHSSQ